MGKTCIQYSIRDPITDLIWVVRGNALSSSFHYFTFLIRLGEPQWGGTTLKGVDCSAFMQVIFDDYLGEKLPRTTLEQMKVGKKIRRKQVDLGDLVFFKTGPTIYHVGVMVNRRHFLHAGTTGGVMISDLNARYWTVRYLTARRVL